MKLQGLYYITDSSLTRKDIFTDTENALKAGVKIVQYREKSLASGEMYKEAIKLRELCHKYDAKFIMNDRLDLALAVKADGVHLGQDDLPASKAREIAGDNFIIGLSTHSLSQAKDAMNQPIDYIGFGPVYQTSTKLNAGTARGLDEFGQVLEQVGLPTVAIGGIKIASLPELKAKGCYCAAIISDVLKSDDVHAAALKVCRSLSTVK